MLVLLVPGRLLVRQTRRFGFRAPSGKGYQELRMVPSRARARLEPTGGRKVLNIPLYMLQKGFAAIRRLAAAVLTRDKQGLLTQSLSLDFYGAYYLQRIRAALSRAGAIKRTVRTRG